MTHSARTWPFPDARLACRLRRLVTASVVLVSIAFPSARVHAAPDEEASRQEPRSLGAVLWGTPQHSAIYGGMWTRHLHRPGIDNNQLAGIGYRGFFAGTFMNSYHRRSYAVGLERSVASGTLPGSGAYSLGYRFGAIRGYDSRLLSVAGKVPVVPFAQAVGGVSWKGIGVEGTYCVRVVTAGLFVRF